MYEVQWTSLAKDDLVRTITYIADMLKAPLAAEKLLDDIEKETAVLAENPYLSPPFSRRVYRASWDTAYESKELYAVLHRQ